MNTPAPSGVRAVVAFALALALAVLAAPLGCLQQQQPPTETPASRSAGGAASSQSGGGPAPRVITIAPASAHNLIAKASFEDGKSLPWTTSFTLPGDGRAYVESGELCVEVTNKGANRWDAQLRHRDMVIEKGHTYTIRFTMRATQKTRAY